MHFISVHKFQLVILFVSVSFASNVFISLKFLSTSERNIRLLEVMQVNKLLLYERVCRFYSYSKLIIGVAFVLMMGSNIRW